jgi:class 3 adenylate cyclase
MGDSPRAGERETEEPHRGIKTFLIADVRRYTLFAQERGDEAAAKLAGRFASIAREVVEEHGGSVIELRGDEVRDVRQGLSQPLDKPGSRMEAPVSS